MTKRYIIAVIGAGAVGVYYGGRLAQRGHHVHFLARRDYEVAREKGWVIKSCDGDFVLPPGAMDVYDDARKMPKAEVVIVALKSASKEFYEKLVGPMVTEGTTIVALQNGLGNEEKLAELFGKERVVGGVAFVCINRVGPGEVRHTCEGLVKLGEMSIGVTERVKKLAEMFRESGIPCEAIADLKRARWQKLIWNVPFNVLGAALDLTTDKLLANEHGVELVKGVMGEVIDAMRGMGFEIDKEETIRQQIDFTRPMGAYRTSMQIDRQEGRELEIEAMLGEPIRRAKRAGVEVPRLEMLYRMVKVGKVDNISGRS